MVHRESDAGSVIHIGGALARPALLVIGHTVDPQCRCASRHMQAARRRLASQRKIKKSEVDAVIDTHRPFEEIRETVRLMAEEIKERFT